MGNGLAPLDIEGVWTRCFGISTHDMIEASFEAHNANVRRYLTAPLGPSSTPRWTDINDERAPIVEGKFTSRVTIDTAAMDKLQHDLLKKYIGIGPRGGPCRGAAPIASTELDGETVY